MKVEPLPWSQGYEYRIDPDTARTLNLYAYNFAEEPVTGSIRVMSKPVDWVVDRDVWHLTLDPMQRVQFKARVTIPARQEGTLRLIADFGLAGEAALAFRMHGK